MKPCEKRQKVVQRNTGITKYRCMLKECDHAMQVVTEDICDACPLRVYKKSRPCKQEKEVSVENHDSLDEIKEAIKKEGFDPKDVDAVDYPSLVTQLINYKEALTRWQKAGRPTRSDAMVEKLLETHCKSCNWYDPKKKRCRGCGCAVSTSSMAVFNKLRMATEQCPLGKF